MSLVAGLLRVGFEAFQDGGGEAASRKRFIEEDDAEVGVVQEELAYFPRADLGGGHEDREPGGCAEEEREHFLELRAGVAEVRDQKVRCPVGDFAKSGVPREAVDQVVVLEGACEDGGDYLVEDRFVIAVQDSGWSAGTPKGHPLRRERLRQRSAVVRPVMWSVAVLVHVVRGSLPAGCPSGEHTGELAGSTGRTTGLSKR